MTTLTSRPLSSRSLLNIIRTFATKVRNLRLKTLHEHIAILSLLPSWSRHQMWYKADIFSRDLFNNNSSPLYNAECLISVFFYVFFYPITLSISISTPHAVLLILRYIIIVCALAYITVAQYYLLH